MARTAAQNQKLLDDYRAAYMAANPDYFVEGSDYYFGLTYLPGGYVAINQNGSRSSHRPGKIEKMIHTLRRAATYKPKSHP
jgi:hypothetical protein